MNDILKQGDLEVRIVDPTTQDTAGVTSTNRLQVDTKKSADSTYTGLYTSRAFENTGSPLMNVDGSITPVVFTAAPSSNKMFYIARIVVFMEDQAISFTKFGGRAALTNGISLEIREGGVVRDPIEGRTFKENLDMMAFDSQLYSATTDLLITKIEIYKSGTVLRLEDASSDYITFTVNDDLTSIERFNILAIGYEADE